MENKNHILRRVIACVMVVFMTLTAVPLSGFVGIELPKWSEMFATRASALNENGYTYTVSGGKATIIAVDSIVTGDVVIPDTIGGYSVTEIYGSYDDFYEWNGAFENCTDLTSITIPESVTSIGHQAFAGCTGLTKINWNAKNVSYILAGGDDSCSVFDNAGKATEGIEVVFGDTVESIPDFAFCGKDTSEMYDINANIKSVILGNNVTDIGNYAFFACYKLTSVTIGNSVKSFGLNAFKNCTRLTKINWNAENVGDLYWNGYVFDNAGTSGDGIEVVFGNSVKSIPACIFRSCDGLTSITIPDSVTSIGDYAFGDCNGLTSITIPDSVTSIGECTFHGCTDLTSITIPDSVTSIGSSAFNGCTGLTKIFWNAESVSDFYWFDNPFYNAGTAGAGMDIVFGDTVKSIPAYAFYVSDSSYNPKIKSVTIGNSVTSIGSSAFKDCTGLTSITIPDSVTSIGSSAFAGTAWYEAQPFGDVYAGKIYYKYKGTMLSNTSIVIKDGTKGIAGSAFYDCNGLTSITIPDSVTNIGSSAFYDCNGLTSITIPDSVTSIGSSAFYACIGLTSITLPDSVTSIGSSAFYHCNGLTSITIPDSVTSIGSSAFQDCYGLTSITIPDSVKSIGSSAFQDCDGLRSITIPDSVKSIGSYAFSLCTGLTNIIIPDSVTIVGERAFDSCRSLKSVTIGNGVETISKATFENCPLTTIKIGRNVKTIEENAFNGIKSIPEVYYAGSESDWKSISIDQTNDMILRATMHYNVDITHNHSYTSKITKAATCIENGTKTFTCDCGKTYTETIPATGHKSSSWITDKAATCVNDGSKHKECTVCKEILATEELTATGHSFKKEVTAATCVSLGFETKTCLNCSECQFVRVIPAKGHTPSGWKIDNDKGIRFKECTVCSSLLEAEKLDSCTHRFVSEVTDPTCTANGFEIKTCADCGETRFVRVIAAKGHALKTTVTPATQNESGLSITSCKTCGTITKATLIKRIASVSLAKTAYVYNGKAQTPSVVVKDSAGKTLKLNTDYVVKYASGRKNPGQYSVKVTFKGDYSGTKTLTFTIAPGMPTLTATAGTKKAALKWNKQTGATGYVVYMATTKSGKYTKAATLKGNSKVSYTKTGLTKGKTYYFKVCAYTTVGGKTVYGAASAVKAVKVK